MEKYFTLQILGRTLEHLGVQMYKRRNTAIAELIANSWDAHSNNVYVDIPCSDDYTSDKSQIIIEDDGYGMNENDIKSAYLIIGRNRRIEDKVKNKRLIMGRKGIGKLAGFGMAKIMTIYTWKDNICHKFSLKSEELKTEDNTSKPVQIRAEQISIPDFVRHKENGTILILCDLKHTTPINIESIHQSLARRFSRVVKGEMNIFINNDALKEPDLDLNFQCPNNKEYEETSLSDSNKIEFRYGFSTKPIKDTEMRGFTIYVRGKTAQAPNFFFEMEGRTKGQHATKYVTGEIIADYLDEGVEDESDYISTDRQEIDWEHEKTKPLKKWGEKFIQDVFNKWLDFRGQNFENSLLEDESIQNRILKLDSLTQKQVRRIIRILGQSETDPERSKELASALIMAYEYRHFHDVISEIEDASGDPDQLSNLLSKFIEWKVLESRAIYEIIYGRLAIIEKFHLLIINNAPETASKLSKDNMHDIIAQYPWLLNPEWQILYEEKSISKTLEEWHKEDLKTEDDAERYDFLGLTSDNKTVIIEIKRSDHPVEFDELERLKKYKEKLVRAHPTIYMVLISSDKYNVSKDEINTWERAEDRELMAWNKIYDRTKQYYYHYKDVLEGNVNGPYFELKEKEVQKTREIINSGNVHRGIEERKKGLGGQDVSYISID